MFWLTYGNFKIEDFLSLSDEEVIFYYASMLIQNEDLKKMREKYKK